MYLSLHLLSSGQSVSYDFAGQTQKKPQLPATEKFLVNVRTIQPGSSGFIHLYRPRMDGWHSAYKPPRSNRDSQWIFYIIYRIRGRRFDNRLNHEPSWERTKSTTSFSSINTPNSSQWTYRADGYQTSPGYGARDYERTSACIQVASESKIGYFARIVLARLLKEMHW